MIQHLNSYMIFNKKNFFEQNNIYYHINNYFLKKIKLKLEFKLVYIFYLYNAIYNNFFFFEINI